MTWKNHIMKHLMANVLWIVLVIGVVGCSEDSSTVDSVVPPTSSTFTGVRLSQYQFDTDTIAMQPGRDKLPTDPVQLRLGVTAPASGVSTARCEVTFAGKDQPMLREAMTRDGNGTFSANLTLPLTRGDVGDYQVRILGEDGVGNPVNSALSQFQVFFGTRPPVLSELSCPDTLILPNSELLLFVITVKVTDPSGPKDIKRVLLNSFLPSGAPSSGNPITMNDEGIFGDQNSGDGIYTVTVQLPPTAAKGRYRFEFQGFDLSNLASNVIKHYLYVQ